MKKIGMRTIKTGIAVFLAILSGYIGIVQTPVYTVGVCIFSMKNTMKSTIKDSYSRILGTLLGGLVGYIFALIANGDIFSTTIGVIIIIHLCNMMNLSDSSAIASVTFIYIVMGVGQNHPIDYSIMRTMDTMAGVIIALVVNYGISRRKYIEYLFYEFNLSYDECINIAIEIMKKADYSSYIEFRSKYDDVDDYYNKLLDEVKYTNKNANYNKIQKYFDMCDQLLHHLHGLYLLSLHIDIEYLKKEGVYKYHVKNVLHILSKASDTNINLDYILKSE